MAAVTCQHLDFQIKAAFGVNSQPHRIYEYDLRLTPCLTWRAKPPSQEQAFGAMKTALSLGANFWNGGELYGTPERNSLHLLNEYFSKYPEDAEKVVISIKGGTKPGTLMPDDSPENLRRSVYECLKHLSPVHASLDMFECARVDPNHPIEDTISTLAEYVKAGKLGGISLSEVRAETIRRAAKVHKISCVEVELSLWCTDPLENGIAEACAELGIPIAAYSPLGRGFLTGQIKSPEDIPEDDFRRMLPRFQGEAFYQNIKLVHSIEGIASKKSCTPGQIAIAWLLKLSGSKGMPVIIPIPGATTNERVQENTKHVELDDGDMAEIARILKENVMIGGRYPKELEHMTNG